MKNIRKNVYEADPGMLLVNKNDPMCQGRRVYLCATDSIDNWTEMTKADAAKAMEAEIEKENAEAAAKEAAEKAAKEAEDAEENPEN